MTIQNKTKRFSMALTPDEEKEIRRAARSRGKRVTVYAREVLTQAARRESRAQRAA